MSTRKEVEKQFKELKGERKWFKELKYKPTRETASIASEIKKLGDIGCFHTDKQIVMSTSKYEQLAMMGYTQKLICTLCKKQVGVGDPQQRAARMIKYKTVFQVVIETRASNMEQAESEALKQLIKFVGEKQTSQIISRNYPVTTEIE